MSIGQMNFSPTDDANRIYAIKAAELRSIPNTPEGKDKLQSLVNSAFGSLALIEIDKRNRAEMMKMAQNQQGMTGTMADASIAEMMRNRMMERMAGDERMGIPNVVNQFEQRMANEGAEGAEVADTGEGMFRGAGGGIVAFQQGGKAQMESDRAALIDTARKLGYSAADIATLIPRAVGGAFNAAVVRPARAVTGEEIPFIPDVVDEGDYSSMTPFYDKYVRGKKTATERGIPTTQDTDYPDESRRGSASYLKGASDRVPSAKAEAEAAPSKTGIKALGLPKVETDPEKLIAAEDALLKKMGLGAYGEKVRESMGKRRGEAEERFQKGIGSETFLEAAEAAGGGGKRLTGLGALAAAVGGAGKAATRLRREKDTALDKVTEGEERLLLAEDLYKRGRVSDATKMAKAAEQQIFDNTLKLRNLDLTEQKINATLAAAKARSSGAFRGGADVAKLATSIQEITSLLADPKLPPQQRQMYEQQLKVLKATQARILLQGASIEDQPD
jgi:hypothetical protein